MEIQVIEAEKYGLDKSQVSTVDLAFAEKVRERELLSESYGLIIAKDITEEVSVEARELRLKAVKVKSSIAAIHKTQKEFALSFGKYCDAWKNKETEPVQQMIDGLLEIEKFQEIKLQKEKDALQEKRVKELSLYAENAEQLQLADMPDDVWDAYLSTKKKAHEDKVAADKQAEADRIKKEKEDAIERARIVKENEELKRKAELAAKRERIEADKRAEVERQRLAEVEAERKRLESIAAKEKAQHEAELKIERDKAAKIQEELRLKQEADKKAIAEAEALKQAELSKGDAAKIKDLIADFEAIKTKYTFESAINKKKYADTIILIDKVINHIKK